METPLLRTLLVGAILILLFAAALSSAAGGFLPPPSCATDTDCTPPPPQPHSSKPDKVSGGAWACVAARCMYLVAAGQVCSLATQCVAFHQQAIVDPALRNATANGEWCAPRFCGLQSTCDSAWSVPSAPQQSALNPLISGGAAATPSCCAGQPVNAQCDVRLNALDTCGTDAHCAPVSPGASSLERRCVDNETRDHIWIGIVMTLIGATTLNIGLNLQKLGYRRWDAAAAAATRDDAARDDDVTVIDDKSTMVHLPVPRFEETRARGSRREQIIARLAFWRTGPFLNPIWLLGFALFILGNVVNFVALRFAPQSLVAPLGSVSLVTNVVIAPWINKERLSRFDVIGILLICAGSAVSIVFSGYVAPEYELCVLLNLLQRRETVAYLCVIGAGVLAFWVFIRSMEHRLDQKGRQAGDAAASNRSQRRSVNLTHVWHQIRRKSIDEPASSSTSATATPAPNSPAVLAPVSEVSAAAKPVLLQGHVMDPIAEEPADLALPSSMNRALLEPANTVAGQYLLPLSYAALGGLMGTLTTLFAKSLINLFSATIAGDNQFTHFLSWVIFIVTVATAIGQVFWINMGLRRYDALLQVPVFYCVWTIMDIIGGGIYYDEFRAFTPTQYACFSLGVLLIFAGVGLLAKRLKRVEESNIAEERQRQSSTPT